MVFDCEYSLSKCTCVQIKINKCIQKAVHLFDAIYFLHSENVKMGSNKIYWFGEYYGSLSILYYIWGKLYMYKKSKGYFDSVKLQAS